MGKKKPKVSSSTITDNRKARHDYHLESDFEAGLVLQGWEVKSIRAGRAQLKDSYITLKHNEAWLTHAHISVLETTSTHYKADPYRPRKLLLNRHEINKLRGAVEKEGYTIVPVKLYWKKHNVKLKIAIAKGKKQYDKRATSKARDWQREKARLLKP